MTTRRIGTRRTAAPLWKTILQRYGARRAGLRARVPLVHFRYAGPRRGGRGVADARPHASTYHIAVSLQLSASGGASRAAHGFPLRPASSNGAPWTRSSERTPPRIEPAARPDERTRTIERTRSIEHAGRGIERRIAGVVAFAHRGHTPARVLDRVSAKAVRHASTLLQSTVVRTSRVEQNSPLPRALRAERPASGPRQATAAAPRHRSATRAHGAVASGIPLPAAARSRFAQGLLRRRRADAIAVASGFGRAGRPPGPRARTAPGVARSADRLRAGGGMLVPAYARPAVNRSPADTGLFPLPATRSFARQPPVAAAEPVRSAVHQTAAVSPSRPAPAPPPLDIARLSDDVYRHIQRKIRIDRERRGL